MLPQSYSQRTAQIVSADNREYEVAGTALNCLFLIEAMRARHWKGPSPCRAPCAVKSWPIGLPEADDSADRDGDRNRDQNPEQDREKDGQGQGPSNFADPADLASPPRTVLGERIRFDGARLGGNAPDL